MKTNVIYLNQEYNVNPGKQAVHCRLTFGINLDLIPGINLLENSEMFNDYINDLTDKNVGCADFVNEAVENTQGTIFYTERGWLIFETEGLCKCAPQDNFDAELGKKIASTRAQEEAFKTANLLFIDIHNIVVDEFAGFDVLFTGTADAIKKCKKHAHDLTGHTPVDYSKK